MSLTEFLLARIAEDEKMAREEPTGWVAPYDEALRWHPDAEGEPDLLCVNPARVLAECEAKRQIVADSTSGFFDRDLDEALKHLATVYADHPDYRDEWKP